MNSSMKTREMNRSHSKVKTEHLITNVIIVITNVIIF